MMEGHSWHGGQCLRGDTQSSDYIYRQRIGGIDLPVRALTATTTAAILCDGVEVLHEWQPTDAEEGVEYVRHVPRPVRYATTICILTSQDEFSELVAVDPTSLQSK